MVKLFRPANLAIVGISMMIFWFFLVQPTFLKNEITSALDNILFSALMLMTLLVTAAGYVINDLEDLSTDLINKPQKVVLAKLISLKSARRVYLGLNASALLLAAYIVFQIQSFNVLALCAGSILILYAYSKYFKSSILMGNVIVSMLIGVVPFIFIIVESEAFNALYTKNPDAYLSNYSTIIAFTIFAFLSNLIREIVKDCEDLEGDRSAGINTLATALGYQKCDASNQVLTLLLFLAGIMWLLLKGISGNIFELSLFLFIVLFPIIYLFLKLRKKERNKAKYTSISAHLKLTMLLGLVYLLVHLNIHYA